MPRILFVDDDKDFVRFSQQLLAAEKYEVVTAGDAMEALNLLNTYSFDALITDANMPLYSGFDLIRTVRKMPKFQHMAIAMITGRKEPKDIEKALSFGADDYIVKPLDPPLFLKKVEALFGKKPMQIRPEIEFAKASSQARGQLSIQIEVRSVSEFGITLITQQQMATGMRVNLDTPLFAEIGIQAPHLKVLTSVPHISGDGFETRLLFVGANDATLQKVRAWIVSNTAKLGKLAA